MSFYNPQARELQDNILHGSNFLEWKKLVDIVLRSEGCEYVLHASYLDDGSLLSETFGAKAKWQEDNIKAKCYMLASMSGYLQFLHHGMVTAKEIMESLQQMFDGNKNEADLQDVIQKKLAAGISVHELYNREMGSLKKAEFRMADIRKCLLLMKEAICRLPSCDDSSAVIPFRLGSGKEKSKDKGKRKVDQEDERPRKAKRIEIIGSSPKYGLLKHTGKICPKYLVSS